MKDNKHEVSIIRSSAAEYLTFITATGESDVNAVYFDENVNFLFRNNKIPLSETISNYYFFNNSKEYFASACYMLSYDFVELLTNYTNQIELFKERLN